VTSWLSSAKTCDGWLAEQPHGTRLSPPHLEISGQDNGWRKTRTDSCRPSRNRWRPARTRRGYARTWITSHSHPRFLGLKGTFSPRGDALVDGQPWDSRESAAKLAEIAGSAAKLVRYEGFKRFDVAVAGRNRRDRCLRSRPSSRPRMHTVRTVGVTIRVPGPCQTAAAMKDSWRRARENVVLGCGGLAFANADFQEGGLRLSRKRPNFVAARLMSSHTLLSTTQQDFRSLHDFGSLRQLPLTPLPRPPRHRVQKE